jgi:hypothetical protein
VTILGAFLAPAGDAEPKDRTVDGDVNVLVGVDARHFGANDIVIVILEFLDANRGVGDEVVVKIRPHG